MVRAIDTHHRRVPTLQLSPPLPRLRPPHALGHLRNNETMPTTLKTAMKHFGLEDRLYVVPRCGKCHRLVIKGRGDA